MSEIDKAQEQINEKSYKDLLIGSRPARIDPTKDPRWHAVHGMSMSINILVGKMEKMKKYSKMSDETRALNHSEHLRSYFLHLSNEIDSISKKKAKLKEEIIQDKRSKTTWLTQN